MTMIYTADHVDRLVGEIRHWDPKDKDLRRIADVLPTEVLEAAYVVRLDKTRSFFEGRCAETIQQKLVVMRRIFAAWCRAERGEELGVMIAEALGDASEQAGVEESLVFGGDSALADAIEKRYPPQQ